MRGAYLHVLSDLLGSVAVIIAGLIIHFTGWLAADTIASLAIAAMVLPRALRLLADSVSVLLNRAPAGIDTQQVAQALAAIPGVSAIHDLHIGTTDGSEPLVTCHLVLGDAIPADCSVLDQAHNRLREFGIEHVTIQLEVQAHLAHEAVC